MNKLKIILPIIILAFAAGSTALMIRSRQPVETVRPEPTIPLVRTLEVEISDHPIRIGAQGTVQPRTQATLVAQVAGEIISTARDFVAGGFFGRGDLLVRLDPRDHELAVERATSEVAQVELRMVQERAESRVAQEEWATLGDGGEPDPLVIRQPQLAQLEAARTAAQATVRQAELGLERTTIRAPYAGRIRTVHVGLGQYVTPGTPLATVHPVDYAEVRLPVPDSELAFLDVDVSARGASRQGRSASRAGAPVTLRARFAGAEHSWPGHIVRSEGELDPSTRMIHLVVRVEDPYRRRATTKDDSRKDAAPLPVGLFVDAEIDGIVAPDVALLPRSALRKQPRSDQYEVLIVDANQRLRIRPVTVLRAEGDRVLIAQGLENGEEVVVSSLDVVVDGMPVRTVPSHSTSADGGTR